MSLFISLDKWGRGRGKVNFRNKNNEGGEVNGSMRFTWSLSGIILILGQKDIASSCNSSNRTEDMWTFGARFDVGLVNVLLEILQHSKHALLRDLVLLVAHLQRATILTRIPFFVPRHLWSIVNETIKGKEGRITENINRRITPIRPVVAERGSSSDHQMTQVSSSIELKISTISSLSYLNFYEYDN